MSIKIDKFTLLCHCYFIFLIICPLIFLFMVLCPFLWHKTVNIIYNENKKPTFSGGLKNSYIHTFVSFDINISLDSSSAWFVQRSRLIKVFIFLVEIQQFHFCPLEYAILYLNQEKYHYLELKLSKHKYQCQFELYRW